MSEALRRPASCPVSEVWAELGATMRLLRVSSGMSLRQAELASGRGRGSLSLAENGKAQPSRELVDWYEHAFGGDGLLLSIYAEARSARGPTRAERIRLFATDGTDGVVVEGSVHANGLLVAPGATVAAGWTLRNTGSLPWHGRQLRRVGAHVAVRLINSAAAVPVPDCAPGERVDVQFELAAPSVPGTFCAYWDFGTAPLLAVVLTVAA